MPRIKKPLDKGIFTSKAERDTLLDALKRGVSPDDVEGVHSLFPERSREEVEAGLQKLKVFSHTTHNEPRSLRQPPIDSWLRLLEDLTIHVTDLSKVIPKVLLLLQLFEARPRIPEGPNISSLYNYLVALLMRKDLPEVEPAEAAVLLHCMDLLGDIIKADDRSQTAKMVRQKHRLIEVPSSVVNYFRSVRYRTRQAFNTAMHADAAEEGLANTPELTVPESMTSGAAAQADDADSVQSAGGEPPAEAAESAVPTRRRSRRSGRPRRAPRRLDMEGSQHRYSNMELEPTALYPLNPLCLTRAQSMLRPGMVSTHCVWNPPEGTASEAEAGGDAPEN